jgi:hypothetical protein
LPVEREKSAWGFLRVNTVKGNDDKRDDNTSHPPLSSPFPYERDGSKLPKMQKGKAPNRANAKGKQEE